MTFLICGAKILKDAWGKCTVDSDSIDTLIAERNPFRYRGYYYDSEIGMYYLQSRYYDPNTGRFVNGDAVESSVATHNILTNNSFAYCCNNTINDTDQCGNLILSVIKKIFVGAFKGFFKQLCIDFIEWVFKKIFRNYRGSFELSPTEDYIACMLSSIATEFDPLNFFSSISSIVCLFVKYIPKLISGRMKKEHWANLLLDIVEALLKQLLKKQLKGLKNKRTKIHKKMSNLKYDRNTLRLESKTINAKFRYLGVTFNFYIPVSKQLMSSLVNILF